MRAVARSRGLHDLVERGGQLFIETRLRSWKRGVAEDDGEDVVEIVRHAGGEAADGFHFLRLAQFVFEPHPLGDVLEDEEIIGCAAELEIFRGDERLRAFRPARVRMLAAKSRTARAASRVRRARMPAISVAPPRADLPGQHVFARGADEFEKTRVGIEEIGSLRSLDRHRHRAAVESFGKTLLGTAQHLLRRQCARRLRPVSSGIGFVAAPRCADARARRVPPSADSRSG